MYHNTHKDVLEASDITAVHDLRIERRANGKRYAHLLVEIADHKELTDEPGAVKLHVTDGVSHAVHPVTPLPEDATDLPAEEEAGDGEEVETEEEEVKAEEPVKPARSSRKR